MSYSSTLKMEVAHSSETSVNSFSLPNYMVSQKSNLSVDSPTAAQTKPRNALEVNLSYSETVK
jgi:hypothetical protein